jgi:hypothetical protein
VTTGGLGGGSTGRLGGGSISGLGGGSLGSRTTGAGRSRGTVTMTITITIGARWSPGGSLSSGSLSGGSRSGCVGGLGGWLASSAVGGRRDCARGSSSRAKSNTSVNS